MLADHTTSVFTIKYRKIGQHLPGSSEQREPNGTLWGHANPILFRARVGQDRPFALVMDGGSSIYGSLVLDLQLSLWLNWKSGSGWASGSSSRRCSVSPS